MEVKEQKVIQTITEAMAALPHEKREFILGYAEGVMAMADRTQQGAAQDGA